MKGILARAHGAKAPFICIGTSLLLFILVGGLGTSAAQPPLPQRHHWLPPWHASTDPSPWLVSTLLVAAILLGAAGIVLGLRAIADGSHIKTAHGVIASIIATLAVIIVPPMGSADVLVNAAYGRIANTGGDPYTTTANDLGGTGDPIGQAVEPPWQDTPSIYGPLATAEQRLASGLGGDSTHATVWWLAVFGALAFVGTGILLLRLAGDSPAARTRVILLWSLNPLLLYEVVNGAHVDGFGIFWAVAALTVLRHSALGAGGLVGAAVAVKLSFGLYALALAWPLRHSPRQLSRLMVGVVGIFAVAYSAVGLHALDQARAASRFVSFAMPSRLLVGPLESVLPNDTARTIIAVLAWVALAVLAWWLWRGWLGIASEPGGDPTPEAVRAAAVLGLAWVLTAAYSLPWYDVVAWAPFAVVAASSYDRVLTARTTMLALAYVPGRVVDLPGWLDGITRNVRGTLAPVVGIVLIIAAVWLASGRAGAHTSPPPVEPPRPDRRRQPGCPSR